jgi:hypothetical protein
MDCLNVLSRRIVSCLFSPRASRSYSGKTVVVVVGVEGTFCKVEGAMWSHTADYIPQWITVIHFHALIPFEKNLCQINGNTAASG